jgi:hypothetical protein
MSDSNLSSPTPTPTPAAATTPASELAELKEICADLRWQAHTLRIALLLVAAAVAGFFWVEVRRNSQLLTVLRPQAAQVIEASKQQDPIANRFLGQLVEFSKAHPEFTNILRRYPIQGTPAPATAPAAAPTAAPKPAAAPAPTPAAPKK